MLMKRGNIIIAIAGVVTFLLTATPALALDLNAYRRAHKLPPLAYGAELAWTAQAHASDLATPHQQGLIETLTV